jgi:hypothetical protein
MTFRSYGRRFAGALGLAFMISCGGGGDTPSAPVTPTPQATPVPTPTPPQALPPRGMSCGLAYGDPTGSCRRSGAELAAIYEQAIDLTYARQPQAFDFNEANGNGQYRVVNPGLYIQGLLANLESLGVCADFPEGSEEIQIKNSQAFHEQWDHMAGGYVRRGESAYRATCEPAGFPLPEAQRFPVPGCTIGASRSFWCQRENSSRHIGAVLGAQQELFRTRPELFDMNDRQRGTDWPKVLNPPAYDEAMRQLLTSRGYCVVVDAELGIKDNNNTSENFDILTSGFYARGGDGSYRATCTPADF